MKRILIGLLLVAICASAAWAQVNTHFTTVAEKGQATDTLGVALNGIYEHLRIRVVSSDSMYVCFQRRAPLSTGIAGLTSTGLTKKMADGTATWILMYDDGTLAWNVYNGVMADSLTFDNRGAAASIVIIEGK